MIDQAVEELTPLVGTSAACRALGAARATIYRPFPVSFDPADPGERSFARTCVRRQKHPQRQLSDGTTLSLAIARIRPLTR